MTRDALSPDGLSVRHLTCRRGGRIVLRDLSFDVHPGETLILRGPNGSGKSTLLRAICGLLPPESGIVAWQGIDIRQDRAAYQDNITFLGHKDGLKTRLTVAENLAFARAWRATGANDNGAMPVPPEWYPRAVGSLSAGQRRRVALAAATLASPALWLLDEPTNHLDKAGIAHLRDRIARHGDQGGASLIASHDDADWPVARVLDLQHLGQR